MSSTPTPITRPNSSASVRPSSGAQFRPPSSASTLRPSSSLSSNRPISRISQRSGSRLSRRPSLRQASRITPLTQILVTQITGITPESDPDNFRIATEYVIKHLETSIGGSSGQDMSKMDQHFYGYCCLRRT
jgi:gamma-tubulin complex component 5